MNKAFDWKEIWDRKARQDPDDQVLLSGFERTTIDPDLNARKLAELIDLKETDHILQVGCAACILTSRW